jgi:hypothetical protein
VALGEYLQTQEFEGFSAVALGNDDGSSGTIFRYRTAFVEERGPLPECTLNNGPKNKSWNFGKIPPRITVPHWGTLYSRVSVESDKFHFPEKKWSILGEAHFVTT